VKERNMSANRKSLVTQAGPNPRVPLTVTGVTPTLRNPLVPAVQTRRGGAHGRSKGGARAMKKRELAEQLHREDR
jgi:hypothetical protein